MAILNPSALPASCHSGGLYCELDTLPRLQEDLPDGYEIFHNVSLSSVHDGQERHGEIDIVIMAPSGNLLLMEIKAGDVNVRNGEIYKLYTDRGHDVSRQGRVQYAAMVNCTTEAGLHPYVSSCLILPDTMYRDRISCRCRMRGLSMRPTIISSVLACANSSRPGNARSMSLRCATSSIMNSALRRISRS